MDDRAEGKGDELKGKAQEAFGDLTGDDEAKAKGQANQGKGKVEQVGGDIKQAVSDATDK